MGLRSHQEQRLAEAQGEFVRAWDVGQNSYEVCYSLLLTRLTLGKVDGCLELLPRAIELATQRGDGADEKRFLVVLQALLQACAKGGGNPAYSPVLADLTPADEQRLLKVVRSLGQLDTVHSLLKTLTDVRPRSVPVREAYIEAVLVKAKELVDRCNWTEAELLLRPLARDRVAGRDTQVA